MSEASILQSIVDHITEVIEKVRPHCKQEFHIYPEPVPYDRMPFESWRPLSARNCAGTSDDLIPGYEWWPALEPIYKLRERVARYQSIAQSRNES
jgi:hypothetical protein